jgi:pimeloyl-ACP methyl ester carboxylesterase
MAKNFFLKTLKAILLILVLLSLIPYAIPLPAGNPIQAKPYEESLFADIDGVDLHYRLWFPEEIYGKVLFVHGLGGSTFSWRHNILPLVDAGFLVAAVDLPGFGYSSRQKGIDHSQKNRSKIVWNLLQEIELSLEGETASQSWNLVGHSMGGGTVAAMALQEPSRVESLVFVAGAVYGRPAGVATHLLRYPPARRWLAVAARYYIISPERIKSFLASAYGEEPSPHAVEGYLEPLTLEGTVHSLIDMTLTAKDIPPLAISTIEAPALLIWGNEDQWVPPEVGQRLANDLGNAQLVIIPATHHCPMETNPSEFNSLMLGFLFPPM